MDAQSWLGFEHRIQERRFKALLETITTAIAQRDGVSARIALEEARELRPSAPELETLAARVALLPSASVVAEGSAISWYRGLGAVAMFAVGIGLVIGIESLRPATGDATAETTVAQMPSSAAQPSPAIGRVPAEPAPAEAITDSQRTPTVDASAPTVDASARTIVAAIPPSPAPAVPAATTVVSQRQPQEVVGTAGVTRAARLEATPPPATNRPTLRATDDGVGSGGRTVEPAVQTSREVPDDYVATVTRNDVRPAFVEPVAPAPSIAASVIPQPVSVTAPPPVLPATNVAAGAAMVSRSDNTRVAQVLNQYARAYGQLDPNAARAVWPTVDERALTRAFASLESQDVSFDRCDIDVKGNLASASCRGTASYVGKVGSRQARTEARQWNFELRLHGDDWKIEKAQASAR